jgi:ring-1,2-phenylacetyl-CoA epoxidase subunit PaaE
MEEKRYIASVMTGYHNLTISQIQQLTKDAVQITFHTPEELSDHFRFIPGQHIDLKLQVNGIELIRSYSICSGPGEALSIAVKAIPGGTVSTWLNSNIEKDQVLQVSEPRGSFKLDPEARRIVLIGAGSGITPLLSMAKHAINQGKEVSLIYGNRTVSSIMFYDDIRELGFSRVFHFLSGETNNDLRSGRISRKSLLQLEKEKNFLSESDAVYLCGPEGMIHEVKSFLESLGVSADRIHSELFTAPSAENGSGSIGDSEEVSIASTMYMTLEGDKYAVHFEPGMPNILAAAEQAGLDVPYSCRTGICGSCRAKVLTGTAVMKSNYALTPDEVDVGYILTCQASPTCMELRISYDE